MGKIIICSRGDYPASERIYSNLKKRFGNERILWAKDRISLEKILSSEKIDHIIFAFWSTLIPDYIINNYKCISFHAGDLPKDRGGSPIQNQIMAGKTSTVLSAFKTSKKMDAGPMYIKRFLSLDGDLKDIHKRMALLIESMVAEIINNKITPRPQKGKPTYFKRRTPSQSEIKPSEMTAKEIYNLIRCLNMKPYPHAFIKGKDGKKCLY